MEEEEIDLAEYNEDLIRRLENKMLQLEEANRAPAGRYPVGPERSHASSIAIHNAHLHGQVQRHAEALEERARQRTTELRKIVNLMAGREVRMAGKCKG